MIPDPIHQPSANAGDVLEGVRSVLRTHLAVVGPVEPETDLTEELQLDSLGQLTLIVELENHFRICIDGSDERAIETVGDVVGVVEKQLARGGDSHE